MRKFLLSTIAAIAVSASSVFAADLPSREAAPAPAPVYAAPIFTWTGFYVGAQVGYGMMEDRYADPIVPYIGKVKPNGAFGGLHAGYNWQIGSMVVGLEADANIASLSGQAANNAGIAPNVVIGKTKLNWDASLRARVGFAVDRALFFVTGGLAAADFKLGYQFPIPVGVTDSFSKTALGWTVGAGVEYAISNNWTARAEYRYADYGTATGSIINCCAAPPNRQDHKLTSHTVRVGLSYKFGGPAAGVVAKY